MKKPPSELEMEAMQPDYVRELLEAGRADAGPGYDYDVDAGLARHIAAVEAGTALPPWAESLVAGKGGGAGAAAAGAAAKLATGKLIAGVAIAVVTAGAIAAVVIGAPEKHARLTPPSPKAVEATTPHPVTAVEDEAASAAEPEAAGEVVELDIAPVTAARAAKRTAQPERAEPESKPAQAPRAVNANANTKSIEALIEAVGKPGGASPRVSGNGHVDLVPQPQGAAVARRDAPTAPGAAAAPAEQATAPAPAPALDDARLEREMGMLAVAQKVLKTDPERALRLARQGEQEFAGSMFTQERQQVLLLALIELGRVSEAKRLALPYLKRYPNGPYSDRVRSALAAAKPEN